MRVRTDLRVRAPRCQHAERGESRLGRDLNAPTGHALQVVPTVPTREVHRARDIDVSPADQTFLVLVVGAVDDEPVDEALQEDGGGARTAEAAAGVAQVHAAETMIVSLMFEKGLTDGGEITQCR